MRREFITLAVIAFAQGVFFIAMAFTDVVAIIRQGGLIGPAEVSNPQAFTTLVVIFVLFGLAMLLVGWGWLNKKRWARGPFVVMQMLTLVVSVPNIAAPEVATQTVALIATLAAVGGAFLAVYPPVTRELFGDKAVTKKASKKK